MKKPQAKYRKGEELVLTYDPRLNAKVLAIYYKATDNQYYYKVNRYNANGFTDLTWISEPYLRKARYLNDIRY